MDTWCHGDLAAVLHASHFLNTNTHNIKNSYDMGLTVETSELQDKPNIIFDRSVKCDHQRRRTLSMMANSEEGLDDSYHSRPFFPARNSLSQRRRRQQQLIHTLSMMANYEEDSEESYHSPPLVPVCNGLSQRRQRYQRQQERRRRQQQLIQTLSMMVNYEEDSEDLYHLRPLVPARNGLSQRRQRQQEQEQQLGYNTATSTTTP